MVLETQKLQEEVGHCVDIGALARYGISLTPLAKALDRDVLEM